MNSQVKILEPADIRQPNHWACGACASMAVASLFGVGPTTLEGWIDLLGTSEEKSTSPQAIIRVFTDLGLLARDRQLMNVEDLAASVDADSPVICPVQDYTGVRSSKAAWDYGHYLPVIGVLPNYIVVQDSSIENALGVPGGDVPPDQVSDTGNIAAPGRVLIYRDAWMANGDDGLPVIWRDVGEDGTKYIRYGISIGRPPAAPPPPDRLTALQTVLATLRAQHWLYYSLHWQARDYQRHLLFQRLYESLPEQFDTLAEKLTSFYGRTAVNPATTIETAGPMIGLWDAHADPLEGALHAESDLRDAIAAALGVLTDASHAGVDNLLRGIFDDHETNIYLLAQAQGA